MKKILTIVCLFAMASCTKPSTRGSGLLEISLNRFMSHQAVNANQFPWFDPLSNRVDIAKLRFALETGQITQEHYDAFIRHQIFWVLPE